MCVYVESDQTAQYHLVAVLVVRFALVDEKACLFKWPLASCAHETLGMVLGVQCAHNVANDRLAASLAAWFMQLDMALRCKRKEGTG